MTEDNISRAAVEAVVERAISRCCLLGERVMLAEVATEIRSLPPSPVEGEGRHYTFIGADHPPGYRRVGSIDVADPADVSSALGQDLLIGTIYDGRSGSVAEPCCADVYENIQNND